MCYYYYQVLCFGMYKVSLMVIEEREEVAIFHILSLISLLFFMFIHTLLRSHMDHPGTTEELLFIWVFC